MGRKPVWKCVRAQAVALYKAGLKQVEISQQLGVSRCCVQNAIKRFEDTGSYGDKMRFGRPHKINERDIRHLKRLVKGEARLSASKITSDLNDSLPKPVTTRTVRNYIKNLSYEYVVKVKKQWLSARHRDQRVAWCREHLNWTAKDSRNVIFSDESTFYVLKRKSQCKIWRLEKEKLLPEGLSETSTGDGGKIGV